jgi:hypothetical protein
MATSINYTALLSLAEPVTGQEASVWGDDVNNGITSYLDIAVAGTNNITVNTDVTLTLTTGSYLGTGITSSTAQYAILNCTGARTAIRYINAPNSSKIYTVINNTSGGFAVVIRGVTGPTAGVSVANGEKCVVAWDTVANDFVRISSSSLAPLTGIVQPANGGTGVNNGTNTITVAGNLTTSGAYPLTLTTTGSTNITLPTSGTLVSSTVTTLSNLASIGTITTGVWNGTTVATGYGGTGLTSFTSGGAVYATSTSALTTGTLPIASGGTGGTTQATAQTSLNVPSTTGTGASGTWPISITGSSASASTATTATNIAGGAANQIPYQSGSGTTTFVPVPTVPAYLQYTGSGFAWNNGAGMGSVSSVAMTVPSFLSVSGSPITTTGTLAVTLSGTALPVANGGTGATTLTGYVYGNGTGAMTASTTIPVSALTGTLPVTSGGTGVTTSTGSGSVVLNTSPTLVTPILGTPTSVTLTNATGLPLTTGVTGTLPIINGGTGQTTASAAFNALSPITTTGDLIIGNGTNSATRLAIGASTYVLTSDGTTASWTAPAIGVTPIDLFYYSNL